MEFIHPIKVWDYIIPNNIWLAPMAGYSCKAFRLFARKFGAGFAITEMVSLEGLIRNDKKTWKYVDIDEEETTAIQLFGKAEPEKFYKASKILQSRLNVKIIDVNFGCPVRKVVRSEAGSFLLKNPLSMGEIVKALKDSGVIVSAKIRCGFDRVNIEETIPVIDKAGADIIILHPRLATQFYTGRADWSLIKIARSMTDKILIGSGDICTPMDVRERIEYTDVDGVMIGRYAVGSPYIFKQVLDFFYNGEYRGYELDEIKKMMLEFANLYMKVENRTDLIPIRSTLIQYVKNFKNSSRIREKLSKIKTLLELENVIKDWN